VHVAEDGTLSVHDRIYSIDFLVSPDGKLTSVKDWVIDSLPPLQDRYRLPPLPTPTPSRIYKRPVQQRIELIKEDLYLIQYKSVWYLANPGDLLKESLTAKLHSWLYDQHHLRNNDWIAYKVIKQLNKKELKKYKEKGLIT